MKHIACFQKKCPDFHRETLVALCARNQELEFQQQCHVQVPVFYFIIFWLVVSTPLKNMSSSVGIVVPNIWKNKKIMFQNTNQHR